MFCRNFLVVTALVLERALEGTGPSLAWAEPHAGVCLMWHSLAQVFLVFATWGGVIGSSPTLVSLWVLCLILPLASFPPEPGKVSLFLSVAGVRLLELFMGS